MKHILILVFTFCTLLSYGQNKTSQIERKGFVIGFGVGAGVINITNSIPEDPFEDTQGGIVFPNLKIGWMLNERLAILISSHGLIYNIDGKDRSFDALAPTVQFWFNDRIWINGSIIGLAIDAPAIYEDGFGDEAWNFGHSVSLSSGYEIVQTKKFSLDLQTNLSMGRTNLDNEVNRDGVILSFGLGFNWY